MRRGLIRYLYVDLSGIPLQKAMHGRGEVAPSTLYPDTSRRLAVTKFKNKFEIWRKDELVCFL